MAKPGWLTITPASTEKYNGIRGTLASLGLNTVCSSAHCPNTSECWSAGTATFMVLGNTCTRGCRFCAVPKGAKGAVVDRDEPERLAKAIREWRLKYAVVTSVCRDDLEDQGSCHFAACIKEIKRLNPGTMVEVLIPDFHGSVSCLKTVADANPDVIGHNVETVERLSSRIRDPRASYKLSLAVLKAVKKLDGTVYTKSAMMLGFGETESEVIQTMKDLRQANVDFLAIGQYLRPGVRHAKVEEYISPEKFEALGQAARKLGFMYVASGPFVRSSYRAQEAFLQSKAGRK